MNTKIELLFDWRHWLFGVNWNEEKTLKGHYFAIHFGPLCWMRTRYEET